MSEKKLKKTRFLSLVSYISDSDRIADILNEHMSSIRAFAFIKHDKDETAPHHHILIRTYSNWTCQQVAKWFEDKETNQNTFCESIKDRASAYDYLTHENEEDKIKYSKDDIVEFNACDILPKDDRLDDTYEIIENMLNGMSIRDLVKSYGRDFVYHYGAYSVLVDAIKSQEGDNC